MGVRLIAAGLFAASCAAPAGVLGPTGVTATASPLASAAPAPATPSPATAAPDGATVRPSPSPAVAPAATSASPAMAAPPTAGALATSSLSPRPSPGSTGPVPAEAPAGQQPGAPGGGLAAVPACSGDSPLFDTIPMVPSDFLAFRPLGWTSPTIHVFPAKHGNFALALPGQSPPVRPVVSPGRIWVTEINTAEFGPTKTGYGITFYPCREFKAYFGHLSGLSAKLLAAASSGQRQCNPPYLTGGVMVTGCRTLVTVELAPGEAVGVSGDAAGVDFGAIDFRIPMLGFAEPKHYCPPQRDGTVRLEGCELLYYVSPVQYFRSDVRTVFESKLGSYDGTVLRSAAPRHGEYMQDRPGTAQGNWFLPGKDLSVAFLQPDQFIALVHEYVDPAQPLFSVGTALKGVNPGVYTFTPRSSGQVDRDFADVRPEGGVFCYEGFRSGLTAGKINTGDPGGIILAQMSSATTLRLEKQGSRGATCGRGPWTFTSSATLYNR